MASRYSSSDIFEIIENKSQYEKWVESETDLDFADHMKRAAAAAYNRELSDRQKQYFTMYFLEGFTVREIASIAGVNPSTVSRTIKRASNNLAKVLAYKKREVSELRGIMQQTDGVPERICKLDEEIKALEAEISDIRSRWG